jgi:hypothetical protein
MTNDQLKKRFKQQTGLGVSEFKVIHGNIIIIPKTQLFDIEHIEHIAKFIRNNFTTVGVFRHKLPKFQPVYNRFGGIELGLRIPESSIK